MLSWRRLETLWRCQKGSELFESGDQRDRVWSAEIHVRETDIKKILKTMGMDGNTQEVQKSRG